MNKVVKFISSRITMVVLLVVYALALAVATFVENGEGSAVARSWVYYSWWFLGLQAFLAINFIAIIITTRMLTLKKWGSLMFHSGFVVILLGAAITHFFSAEGIMHIREGEKVDYMYVGDATNKQQLPFGVTLKDFRLERYPGSHSPSSYESDLVLEVDGKQEERTILMNKVVDIKGYRLFQSSFDKDEGGTVLTVNYDKPGMIVSYMGYILLVLGFICTLFQRNSRFRTLSRQLAESLNSKTVVVSLFLLLGGTLSAQPTVSREHAEQFGHMVVQNPKGRLEPVNTWTSKILRKVYQDDQYRSLTSDQVFLNLMTFPDEWSDVPFIKVKNKDIMKGLGKTGEYLTYRDLFDAAGHYRIVNEVETAYGKSPSERNRNDNDLLKLDEIVNILFQIQQGKMLALFPHEGDKNGKWYSAGDDLSVFEGRDSLFVAKIMIWYSDELEQGRITGNWKGADDVLGMINTYQTAKNKTITVDKDRIEAEITYNKANIFSKSFKFYLILGGVLLLLVFVGLFRGDRWIKYACLVVTLLIGCVFVWHSYGLGLRWYIAGYAPWTNSYESMVYVGWAIVLAGLLFARRSYVLPALTSLLAGMVLFVSSLNWLSPEITPLVPVLQSYWLMLHVAVIMAGYGFFFVSALMGLFNMCLMIAARGKQQVRISRVIHELTLLNEISMILGLMLMTTGTFLGAVWANESWGRYWGWDPKETWALISIIVYTIVSHMRFIPKLKGSYLFNLMSVLAILSVLMTYFGVNYYLSGMHSYGKTDAELLPAPFVIGIVLVVLIAFGAWLAGRKGRKLNG